VIRRVPLMSDGEEWGITTVLGILAVSASSWPSAPPRSGLPGGAVAAGCRRGGLEDALVLLPSPVTCSPPPPRQQSIPFLEPLLSRGPHGLCQACSPLRVKTALSDAHCDVRPFVTSGLSRTDRSHWNAMSTSGSSAAPIPPVQMLRVKSMLGHLPSPRWRVPRIGADGGYEFRETLGHPQQVLLQ
jgi:hypothetical protein